MSDWEREWLPGDIVDAYVPTRSRRHQLIYLGAAGGTWPWRLLDGERNPLELGIGPDNVRDERLLLRVAEPEPVRMNPGPQNGVIFGDVAIAQIAEGLARRARRSGWSVPEWLS